MKLFLKLLFLFITSISLQADQLQHFDSYQEAIAQGVKEDKIVLLFIHHPQCPYCRKMEADTLEDKNVIQYLNKNVIFVTVDLSLEMQTEEVPLRFLPRGTPTTFAIDPKNEELLFSMRGYKSPKSFLGRLSR